MKKMIKNLLGMLLCTVMFSTCFGATTVCAASSGKIEIQLKDLNTAHSNKTGVTFKLYLVGDVLDSGEPVIDPVYGITEYPVTADETEQAVKEDQSCTDRVCTGFCCDRCQWKSDVFWSG